MEPATIFSQLQAAFGEDVVFNFNDTSGGDKDAWFQVEPYSIEEVCTKLKTDPAYHFDYLECITGIDFPDDEQIHVIYHLNSYVKKHRIVLKCFLDPPEKMIEPVKSWLILIFLHYWNRLLLSKTFVKLKYFVKVKIGHQLSIFLVMI